MTAPVDKVWLSTTEAAAYLGYRTGDSVRRLIHAGELKARRRGSVWRIPRQELERLAAAPTEEPAA